MGVALEPGGAKADNTGKFAPDLVYRAAHLYYLDDATQAEIADQLGTSRPTVSRLLAQARTSGIVHIEVRHPDASDSSELAAAVSQALGLRRAYLAPTVTHSQLRSALGPLVRDSLSATGLVAGDGLLVSSGVSIHAVAQYDLPALPGVLVAPTVGGTDQPGAFYQTNEITRTVAVRVHGTPVLLYAPLQPGKVLYPVLLEDESTRRVTELWRTARVALLGVGGPLRSRETLPSVLASDDPSLTLAVGDINARPFDGSGRPIEFSGSERLVAMELDALTRVPHTIAVAVGAAKVPAIVAAVRAGWVNTLVSDVATAVALLDTTR